VFKGVIKVLEEFEPACLSAINFLWLAKVLEVFVIGPDANGMFCSEKERATALKPIDYCGEFFVVHIVVAFGRKETTRVEGNRMNPIRELLHEDSTEGVPRGICLHNELSFPVRGAEHGVSDTEFFQPVEGLLFSWSPCPLDPLFGEVI